jgi:alkylation response protein AidB-like acyl-CoA dehydrogenase
MAAAGLYRLTVARAFGGIEASPIAVIEAIEAVSEADGSAGWNLMIGLEVAGVASGHMSEEAGRAVFADPGAIVSGALRPAATGRPVEGGWMVDGRWPFASGIHNATAFWGGFTPLDGDGAPLLTRSGNPRQLQAIVLPGNYGIVDTWRVAGLRGSGSHDVVVEGAFVPAAFTTDVLGTPPSQDTPLFRYPLLPRISFPKAAVALGIARAAIGAFVLLSQDKVPYLAPGLLNQRVQAQLAAAEAEALVGGARAYLIETVRAVWQELEAGRQPAIDLLVRQRLAGAHATASAIRAVETVAAAAGSSGNFLVSPLERRLRDVRVVAAHPTVGPPVLEAAGKALLGQPLPPGTF